MNPESRLLHLPPSSRYAVTAALCLASLPAGEFHMVAELSRRTGLSLSYLSKILQRLAQKGVLDSRRGAQGGYRLSRPPGRISLAEIITASHLRETRPMPCLIEARDCDCANPCSMHGFTARSEASLRRRLAQTTLADLLHSIPTMDVKKTVL